MPGSQPFSIPSGRRLTAVQPNTADAEMANFCGSCYSLTIGEVFLPSRNFATAHEDTHGTYNCTVGVNAHNVTASTSATNRPALPLRNAATTSNAASLKPPMFKMSSRSGAWVVV